MKKGTVRSDVQPQWNPEETRHQCRGDESNVIEENPVYGNR